MPSRRCGAAPGEAGGLWYARCAALCCADRTGPSLPARPPARRAAEHAELRRGEVQRSLVASSARLAALARATREAKEAVQAALGVKLARRVNIMGEINNLIS